jgi:hypothetical protein
MDVYVDGEENGQYFCITVVPDGMNTGDERFFRIEPGTCPFAGSGYNLYWAGTLRSCIQTNLGTPTIANVGLETIGTQGVDQNIDVRYKNLQVRVFNGLTSFAQWENWGSVAQQPNCVSPSYKVTAPQPNQRRAFLAPWGS